MFQDLVENEITKATRADVNAEPASPGLLDEATALMQGSSRSSTTDGLRLKQAHQSANDLEFTPLLVGPRKYQPPTVADMLKMMEEQSCKATPTNDLKPADNGNQAPVSTDAPRTAVSNLSSADRNFAPVLPGRFFDAEERRERFGSPDEASSEQLLPSPRPEKGPEEHSSVLKGIDHTILKKLVDALNSEPGSRNNGGGSPSATDLPAPGSSVITDKSPKDAPKFAPVIPDSMLLPKGFLDRPNPEHFKVGERKPPLSDEQLIEKGKECLKDWVYTPRFDRKNIELYEDELKRLKKLDPETAKELDDSIQRRKYGFIG